VISGKVEDLQVAQLGNLKHPDQPVVLNRQLKRRKKISNFIFYLHTSNFKRGSLIKKELDYN
jgi:hypothetical protein